MPNGVRFRVGSPVWLQRWVTTRWGRVCAQLLACLVLLTGSCVMPAYTNRALEPTDLRAFPGAAGFGAYAAGGRGGQVLQVTNLNDSGPGSLRAAVAVQGPRVIVFRVSGTIELQRSLVIDKPYITIAGQTAPGGGIALKTASSYPGPALRINTHDVIIRYLRVRPGPSDQESEGLDALQIIGGYNIIIDHSSFSWSVDEVLSITRNAHDVTVQWSIVSEALYHSNHTEGRDHSMGMLLSGEGVGNISLHHNLYAHNRNRNPRIKVGFGVVDVVNNIIYNPKFEHDGWATSHVSDEYARQKVNYVGNYIKLGPNSDLSGAYVSGSSAGSYGLDIYLENNVIMDQQNQDITGAGTVTVSKKNITSIAAKNPSLPISTTTALASYTYILNNAGAILPTRDAVDARIVAEVTNGTGSWINHPNDVGGWPALAPGAPYPDCDGDGMPDTWELLYGLNPQDPADGNADADGDGYTNIEEFLNGTHPLLALVGSDLEFFAVTGAVLSDQGIEASATGQSQLFLPLVAHGPPEFHCPL